MGYLIVGGTRRCVRLPSGLLYIPTVRPTAMSGVSRHRNFVGGRWVEADASGHLPVPDPASGERLGELPLSTAAEVQRSVAAARRAAPGWRAFPVADRLHLLRLGRQRLVDATEEIVGAITRENGKTLPEARASFRRGLEAVDFALGAMTLLQGASMPHVSRGVDEVELLEPLGVVAGVTPFNFPAMIPLWMAPLALACGNAFVLKPSERVPTAAEKIVTALHGAGLPDGVLNLVHGGKEAVEALADHPDVDGLAFVGSAPVAREVYRRSAASGKRVLALAGAKNHAVVLPDAPLGPTVDALLASAFGSAGERCLAASVVVAVEPVGDRLVAALSERIHALRVGSGDAEGTEMGPLIRAEHRDRVSEWVRAGEAGGAVRAAVGSAPATPGFFLPPVLLDRVTPEMAIAQEEVFGPVLCVIRVPSLEAAIAVANRSRFGNAATVFTADGKSAREFVHAIDAGMVGVNIGVPAPAASFPFVGWKGSVFGDLAATGRRAVAFYTRPKTVTTRWF